MTWSIVHKRRGLSLQMCMCTAEVLVMDARGLQLPTSIALLNRPGYLQTGLLTVALICIIAKRDAPLSHSAFLIYASGCNLGFLPCCAEQWRRTLEGCISWRVLRILQSSGQSSRGYIRSTKATRDRVMKENATNVQLSETMCEEEENRHLYRQTHADMLWRTLPH